MNSENTIKQFEISYKNPAKEHIKYNLLRYTIKEPTSLNNSTNQKS